ncbi:MAG: alpha/beta fold hydrolase [Polyangiales bacterium]
MNEILEFSSASGTNLSARMTRPARTTRAYALFAHCFTCSKDLRAVRRITEALASHGVATLSFDFAGLGQSDGEFAETTFSSDVADLVKAAEFMAQGDMAPSILIGHSLGGAAALAAAGRIDSLRAVATLAAPADPAHVQHLFSEDLSEIRERGEATVSLGGRPFQVTSAFIEDLSSQCSSKAIGALGASLLVMHSPTDSIVGIENAQRIYEAARHPKSFVSLDGADHLLSRREDGDYVAGIIAAWAERYLEPLADVTLDDGVVVESDEGLRHTVRAGVHSFIADEPTSAGGTDEGPAPYDFLLASLGACTAMTLRLYAERKKWALENVRVALTFERVKAEDCEECESQTGHVGVIRREVLLEGELDEKQQERLMEIADRCPVHRTLHGEIRVLSTQVSAEA